MAGFLNSSQISNLTGIFQKHFEQFSSEIGNIITVIKEPIQVINSSNSLSLPGYSNESLNETDISYSEVSANIPAMIIYPKDANTLPFSQLKINIDKNDLFVKVEASGAAYIDNGKNERVIINGLSYNIQDTPNVQSFMGLKFYYYKCVATK